MSTAPAQPKRKSWPRRHPLLTVLATFILISVVANIGDADESDPDADASAAATPQASEPDATDEPSVSESDEPTDEPATRAPTEKPSDKPSEEPTTQEPSDEPPSETAATPEPSEAPTPSVAPSTDEQPRPVGRYAVLRVIDGDTVEVAYRGGTSVRVIGIDTPETVHPTEPVECGGPRASSLATSLLTGQRVQLVFDPSQGRTDAYGRTLAYLEAPGLGDFGLAMVKRGAAAEYTYDTTYARQARYTSAEASAQSSDRGLWGTCGGVDEPLAPPTPTETPLSSPTPTETPTDTASEPIGTGCHPSYPGVCIPPPPPDLNCDDVEFTGFRVVGDDPHGFDGEGDGLACE